MTNTVNVQGMDHDLLYMVADWADRSFSRMNEAHPNTELREVSKRICDLLTIHVYDLPRVDLMYIMPALVIYGEQDPKDTPRCRALYEDLQKAMRP